MQGVEGVAAASRAADPAQALRLFAVEWARSWHSRWSMAEEAQDLELPFVGKLAGWSYQVQRTLLPAGVLSLVIGFVPVASFGSAFASSAAAVSDKILGVSAA